MADVAVTRVILVIDDHANVRRSVGHAAGCPPVGPHDTDVPFLAKPFMQQALHQAVEHAIERATLERPPRVPETRAVTHDLVTYARGLRRP